MASLRRWSVSIHVGATLILPLLLVSCSSDGNEQSFSFEADAEGWTAGFADYPEDADLAFYELGADWRPLPDNLDGNGLYIQGHNRSDDLWMYWKRPIDGLQADTAYDVFVRIVIATNVPEGMLGIGGSPGESVWVKAGASTEEPDREPDDQGWWRMAVDIGNQAAGGEDAVVVGTLANPNVELGVPTGPPYALMTLDTADLGLTVTSDASGSVWIFVGTDSGFEGLTAVYYDEIAVELNPSG